MNFFKQFILKILLVIPDNVFNFLLFIIKLKYIPSFKNPKSLNEKINYIKLYSNYKKRELVADRIKVRDYVKQIAPECSLINILWSGKNFTLDIYNSLPNKFVIKANHGSGMVIMVDKLKIEYDQIEVEIDKWIKTNYGVLTRQWVYKNLEKIIIVEEFLDFKGETPPDYKFFCLESKVELVQVDNDRYTGHSRDLFDKQFNKLNATLLYQSSSKKAKKPLLYDKAISIVEKLSSEFSFIRIDLYILDDYIYFGEFTNTPGNGFEPFSPRELDFSLGSKINVELK